MSNEAALLRAPFQLKDLEWRFADYRKAKQAEQQKKQAIAVPYVQSRAIMERLDKVVGAQRWRTSYREVAMAKTRQSRQNADKVDGWESTERTLEAGTAVECTLSIRFGDEWISKSDVGEVTQIASVKGAYSDALKRAAVQWGMGRDLYKLGAIWAGSKYGKPIREDAEAHIAQRESWYLQKFQDAVKSVRRAQPNRQNSFTGRGR